MKALVIRGFRLPRRRRTGAGGNRRRNKTATELLRDAGAAIEQLMKELEARSSITVHDSRVGNLIWVGPTGKWNELDAEGRQLQSRALEDYQRLAATVSVLLRAQPPDALQELQERKGEVLEFLHRENTWSKTTADALDQAVAAFRAQLGQLDNLYDRGGGRDVYVPDTNALLANPALEDWSFEESPQFEIVLAPSVLKELDELKVNHRNEDVRAKAEGLIRRIGGYRKRGALVDGVPLRKGVSTIRTVAIEPMFAESLPWLDPENADDRFVATTIEVIRQHPRSVVSIVTRDVNLQNKAEYARLPFVEPPPSDEAPKRRRIQLDIRGIVWTGANSTSIDFGTEVQNLESRIVNADVVARVGGEPVRCNPVAVNLLVNHPPTPVTIVVPRPALGNLVKALNDEPTLYGRELQVELVVDGDVHATKPWGEHVYTPEENSVRYEIQQREWRIGRGEATAADHEADARAEYIRRRAEQTEGR